MDILRGAIRADRGRLLFPVVAVGSGLQEWLPPERVSPEVAFRHYASRKGPSRDAFGINASRSGSSRKWLFEVISCFVLQIQSYEYEIEPFKIGRLIWLVRSNQILTRRT